MKLIKFCILFSLFVSFFTFAEINVENAQARGTFALATTGAAYLELSNTGNSNDVLTRVSVPETIADSVEIHTVVMSGDMMQMRELEDGLPLLAGETVSLKPGGYHLMIIGLKGPLEPGNSFPLTLHFANANALTIDLPIVKM